MCLSKEKSMNHAKKRYVDWDALVCGGMPPSLAINWLIGGVNRPSGPFLASNMKAWALLKKL